MSTEIEILTTSMDRFVIKGSFATQEDVSKAVKAWEASNPSHTIMIVSRKCS